MANLFDNIKGIPIASPFKLQAEQPVDPRLIVDTRDDLAKLVSEKGSYEGMSVYVKSLKRNLKYINGNWIEESDLHFGYCNTQLDTLDKTVNISDLPNLHEGVRITVYFRYGLQALLSNSENTVTLSVNNSKAYPIKITYDDDIRFYNSTNNIVQPGGMLSLIFREDYVVHLFNSETSDTSTDDDDISYFLIDGLEYVNRSNYSSYADYNADGIALTKIGNPENLNTESTDLVSAINEVGGKINENGIIVESVNKENLTIPFREVFQHLENDQNFSLYPKMVGTWIDGSPIWKVAFNLNFSDMESTTLTSGIITHEQILSPHVKNTNNVIYLDGMVTIRKTSTPSISTDLICNRDNNISWTIPEVAQDNSYQGIYGWYKFAAPASNVISDIDGGTALSFDFQDVNGGSAYSVETYVYDSGTATL